MRRSKLESCEAILETLLSHPLTVDDMAYKTDMDCTVLRRYLNFLITERLVEERPSNKETLHAITEKGTAVFKALNFQRYVEKVIKSIRAVDDASQVIPILSKLTSEEKEKTKD